MDKSNFTKNHTQIAKGIAIILMLIHHLFAFPNRIIGNSYVSVLSIKGTEIEYVIGIFGKICVSMFLFLSGYGMYMVTKNNEQFTILNAVKKVKNIYKSYWGVFILFVPIGFILFEREFNLLEFTLNFIGLSSTYNYEWWFFRLYIELILLLPLMKCIVRDKLYKSIINVFCLFFISKIVDKILYVTPSLAFITEYLIYNDFRFVLMYQSCFFMGYIYAKFDIYIILKRKIIEKNLDNNIVYILLAILVFIIRGFRGSIFIDSILVPIFIFSSVNILYNSKLYKIFIILGNHSMNIWLIHSFYCYYYLQELTYRPKLSIFILIWLILLSLLSSIFVNFVIEYFKNISLKCRYIYELPK